MKGYKTINSLNLEVLLFAYLPYRCYETLHRGLAPLFAEILAQTQWPSVH